MSFIEKIIDKAKQNLKTIVLPESEDIRVIEAAKICEEQKIAKSILIGNREEIFKKYPEIKSLNINIIDPESSEYYESFVSDFYELRKNKGMTIELSKKMMKDKVYFGMMLVKKDLAEGLVSGAIHSTADTLRPALQIIKTKIGCSLVSSFFVMEVPNCGYGNNGTFIFSDCGLNPNPNSEELAQIAINSADTYKFIIGDEPKVGMLSFSTKGSAQHEMVNKVIEATNIVKNLRSDIQIEGELQLDAAIIPEVANLKAPESTVAGTANVLIFPDLNAGNIGYKLTQRLAKASAYGPITQGMAKPVNDLSRGCSSHDIVGAVAITALQAQG